MINDWEISAAMAKNITNGAPLRKLNAAKKHIIREINVAALNGENDVVIYLEYVDVSCLEDWCNIYNWLLSLGYQVQDNSGQKWNPCFLVRW